MNVAPFSAVGIRIAAAVVCDQRAVALIRRGSGGVEQYTLPGGNVEAGESLTDALYRELDEELGLDLRGGGARWAAMQDQMVSRPGPTPARRKLHLIFVVRVSQAQRRRAAAVEHDERSVGTIVWTALGDLRGPHLYPAVGDSLGALVDGPGGAVLLPAMTDDTFSWI